VKIKIPKIGLYWAGCEVYIRKTRNKLHEADILERNRLSPIKSIPIFYETPEFINEYRRPRK
jgi:hypothetical protein